VVADSTQFGNGLNRGKVPEIEVVPDELNTQPAGSAQTNVLYIKRYCDKENISRALIREPDMIFASIILTMY
jgi:hypothetical protein